MIIMMLMVFASLISVGSFYMGKKKGKNIRWGLCIDVPYFYSPKFSVKNKKVVLEGSQNVMNLDVPVQYSIVKMNWYGRREVYGDFLNHGNYDDRHFQHVFSNIPNGDEYRIEIFNQSHFSSGELSIRTD